MENLCVKHNLPEEIVCMGESCSRRVGCQLCIDKHEHKFYLDTKQNQRNIKVVKELISQKISHLEKYTRSNLLNLRLEEYKVKIEQSFEDEFLFFKNKIEEELFNINLWVEKINKKVKQTLEKSKEEMINNWESYFFTAQTHLDSIEKYGELEEHFQKGDWNSTEHVEKSVSFLFSEELFFRFNRNLDGLKLVIAHHRNENKEMMEWIKNRRNEFLRLEICPHKQFEELIRNYNERPILTPFSDSKTKESKDDNHEILNIVKEDKRTVLLYPQTVYEPFQNVYKLIRYDTQVFVTSGSRAINLWTRASTQPEKSYPLNFPSYGILSFVEFGKDEAEQIIYGKSNGEIGIIDMKKETHNEMPAHESAVRDMIQFDSYHFLTASQDWKLKLWAMSTEREKESTKHFASERLTLSGHSGRVYALCKFGPSVLAGGSDGTIKLWDVIRQSYDEVFQQEKEIYALAELRPELFVSGGEVKELRVWDYRKIKSPACKFPVENTCNSILKYDENTIIFNDKNVIKVIDIRNMKQPLERMANDRAFTHVVNSMAFLSDNEIGMGGTDNIISIWKY